MRPRTVPDEREILRQRTHKDIATFEYQGSNLPCIVLKAARFDNMMGRIAGRPVSVNTNLNILHDGLGHVFVEVDLAFSLGGISERFLLSANDSPEFFELLAEHSMLVLSAKESESKVFMIQLPRPERTRNALDLIRRRLTAT